MKKRVYNFIIKNLVFLFLFATLAQAYDFPHFYRASYFFGEPRLQKDKLSSLDISIAGGSTRHARNCNGDTICLMDLYGPSNMQKLGAGIPDKNPTDPADLALIYLERVAPRDGFGFISYSGKFSLIETIFSLTQNFNNGFFVQLLIPFKYMKLNDVCWADLTPTCNDSFPGQNNLYWQMFLNQFDTILDKYCLHLGSWKDTHLGDISFLTGFTCNYQETIVLDYIDFTFKMGVSFPSGRERSLYQIFDIPTGYDGHIGIPMQLDASIGIFDWLTVGAHGDFIPFLSKTKKIRMKTDYNQCGPIKLGQGCALIKKGHIFDIGTYLKADHFSHGFSLLFGYSYDKKYKDELTPKDPCLFDVAIVNTDPILNEWDMHTIHFLAEYDFAKENRRFCPRTSIFYNWQIYGRNVLKNNMFGGSFGFDIAWNY